MFDGGVLRPVLLKLIADGPRHGYELIRAIEELTVNQGIDPTAALMIGGGGADVAVFNATTAAGAISAAGGTLSVQSADGANAKEAQAKLAASAGNSCWPVWQGLAG